ncbi:MAG TPA: tRNA (adenosine(37)-N6)-threonylcarbamoyltransferase complex transferase subunit TsaD [Patescibacteria group bacterium]|nr:tRNA (adenosine(37)-N6)-threonylcarbamoyltransferase complex transferase subunit TsaD [Patescibacteria group bacterium]
MRILGIETSCDETSVALLRVEKGISRIEKHLTASQVLKHEKYGGVVPEVAARLHAETLPLLIDELGVAKKDLDGIAVTRGPGLITSLRVGTDFARSLAYGWDLPIVGVNHIEGHIAANWIGKDVSKDSAAYALPALILVVSGGHTELILMKGFGKYELVGCTLDDAAGEAFDKVAKMLDLGYPGGPAVSKRALLGDPTKFAFPRPLLNKPHFDFSFSGLKTAVLYTLQRKKAWNETEVNDLCASFQAAVVETLVAKTLRAARAKKAKTVFLAGGVAANRLLRETLATAVAKDLDGVKAVIPELEYCTDNAAMIAMAGYFRLSKKKQDGWKGMEPDPSWELGR